MNTTPDIPYETLVDLAEGRVSPADEAVLQAQIAANPEASIELAHLKALITLMRRDSSEDAPSHIVHRAQRIFRATSQEQTTSPATEPNLLQVGATALRRLIATLQFDSFQSPQAYGMRQASSGWPGVRQLLYSAADYDVDIRIIQRDNRWQISGQVLSADDIPESGTIELETPDQHISVILNELAEFALPPVPANNYTLILRLPDVELTIPALEVGPLQP